MSEKPIITGFTVIEFEEPPMLDMGTDYNGFNMVYVPGGKVERKGTVTLMHTSMGITGELVGGAGLATQSRYRDYLIGKNALERELIYQDLKRALRQAARMGMAQIDMLLWDIAGKYYNAPIYELLGGHIKPLRCYASTTHGDLNGGLSTPEAYADFAEQCLAMGYPAFKIHGWGNSHGRPGDQEHPRGGQARGRQDGPAARPGLRAEHLWRRLEGGARLRRRAFLLAGGCLQGWRHLAVRASQAAPADQDAAPADRARAHAWSRTSTLPWPTPRITCAATWATTVSPG